jgi:putative ABC transport system permease protein
VAVLSRRAGDRLFPAGGAVGGTVVVEGRVFRVVGVLADHQPYRPYWDCGVAGVDQPFVYLPLALGRPLHITPETIVRGAPPDPVPSAHVWDDLAKAPASFLAFWVDLPTAEAKAGFVQHLTSRFGKDGFVLRDRAAFAAAFPMPASPVSFYYVLCGLVLAAGGFNMARLFLAKGLVRAKEVGVHRALGAPRRTLFARELLEAGLISVAAALLGLALYVPFSMFYDAVVADSDIPLKMTPHLVVVTVAPTLLVGLLGALYPAWRIANTPPTVYLGRS